jgi:hypothetical protein
MNDLQTYQNHWQTVLCITYPMNSRMTNTHEASDMIYSEQKHTQPAKLACMAASKLILDAAIRFKLGCHATEWIADRFKLSGLGVWPPSLNWLTIYSVARRPSLNRMAVSAINLDAAIQASFAGSDSWSIYSVGFQMQKNRAEMGSMGQTN